MTKKNATKRAARALQAAEGGSYQSRLRTVQAASAALNAASEILREESPSPEVLSFDRALSAPLLVDCEACGGYGYFDEHGEPTIDRRGRKCGECRGEKKVPITVSTVDEEIARHWRGEEIKAREWAEKHHAGQLWGSKPYVEHLARVRAVLGEYGYESPYAVAAWLHDIVEDTPVTLDQIEHEFGQRVSRLVWAVTGVGRNRKERVADTYDKLDEWPNAIPLKAADRVVNQEEALLNRPDLAAMYRKEWPGFRALVEGRGLENDPQLKPLWARLTASMTGKGE